MYVTGGEFDIDEVAQFETIGLHKISVDCNFFMVLTSNSQTWFRSSFHRPNKAGFRLPKYRGISLL